ncbi:MAG: restriction endonuclease subunit S [Myxococcales bacterium]|jgi:type I restriction enzyme S subunit
MSGSNWRKCKLGDVITLKRGYDLPQQSRKQGPYPVVSSAGITDYHAEAKVSGPGVVTGRYGTLGEVFYLEAEFWPLNTALYVQDFKGNEPRFVAYLLRALDFGARNAAGAVPGVNRNHLHAMDVLVPHVAEQRRIAGILSVYDDLIENCERRIRVLDEMARALYREWFVNFRYPGHEKVPLVESAIGRIPRGWQVRRLGEVVTLNYGKALKADSRRGGSVPVYASSGIVGWHDESIAAGPGIVLGRKGNVGSLCWSDVDFFVIDTAYFVTSELPLRFVYHDLHGKNFINGDAAVPGLSRQQAYALETLVPPEGLLRRFAGYADAFGQVASNLALQAKNLRETRDLLLPRLLAGQLSLEKAA